MLFQCRVCLERDKRINDLRDEISTLRKLVLSERTQAVPSEVEQEADNVISGSPEIAPPTNSEQRELEIIQSEAQKLLSGTY